MTPDAADESGAVVGGWRLLRRIGGGAEGTVYLAESTDGLAKQVALKRFTGRGVDRHRRELDAYRRVEEIRRATGTPHLSEGIAAGALPDGTAFMALAYHEGGSLAERVREGGPLAATEAARLAREVLRALSLLHEAGLCHRDVKPHNVLLGLDGGARLGDYGLATSSDREISTGGTPAFAAPEQWDDAAAGAFGREVRRGSPPPRPGASSTRSGTAIDVYGAGATLYFLLTGRPPLPGRPDLFALEQARVPRPLQEALLRALEVEPGERHPSAAAFSEAIRAALEPPAAATADPRRAPPPRRASAALLLIPIALLALGAWLLYDKLELPRSRTGGARSASLAPPSDPLASAATLAPPQDPARLAIALPDGRIVLGTVSGRVLLGDPRAPDAGTVELVSFGRAVLALGLDGDAIVASGDDRRPAPLAPGEAIPEGSILVEGATGRFSFAREPLIREVRLAIPRR